MFNIEPIKALKGFRYFHEINLIYPHIGKNVLALWGTPEFDVYMKRLLTDTRGGTRKGFPSRALNCLYMIIRYHDKLHGSKIQDIEIQTGKADIWGIAI